MKFIIKHDIRGRLRIHMVQSRMSYEEADTLLYYIENLSGVSIRQRMFRLISLRIPEEN